MSTPTGTVVAARPDADPAAVTGRPAPATPVPAYGGAGGSRGRWARLRPGWRFGAGLLGLIVALAMITPIVHDQLTVWVGQRLVDLNVYRTGGRAVLLGHPLYTFVTPWPQYLPFTYPPFAALLATGLSLASDWHDGIVWTVGEILCTGGLTWFGFRRLLPRFGRWWPLALGVLVGAVSWLEPFRDEIRFGQVDELLALMCVADCLLTRTRWPRGLLIGFATAIKLTPGVFIPYLWLTGRRKAAGVATATFLGATAFTAVVLPQDSRVFWLQDVFEPQRTGNVAGTSNQSLRGITARLPLPWHLNTVLWVIAVVIVAVAGYRRVVRAHRAGNELAAVALTGLLAVLLSPIAWVHHMAWLPLVIGVVAAAGTDRRRLVAAALLFAFFGPSLPYLGAALLAHGGWAAPR